MLVICPTYLGVPLCKGAPTLVHFKPIANKIFQKVDAWKGRVLSFPSRLCLINSVITSKFVHTLMIYKWLLGLLKSLHNAIQNFLWSSSSLNRGNILVKWDVCCLPTKFGGLEIKNLVLFNKALIGSLA